MADIRHLGLPEPQAPIEPLTLVEENAALRQENDHLRDALASALAKLNDKEYLTNRVVMLLRRPRVLWIAVGAAAALLMSSGFGIKAVYDSFHSPPPSGHSQVIEKPYPVYYPLVATPRPTPSSPSPQATFTPRGSLPPPLNSAQAPLPVPSPSLPVKIKHCPPPPDVPPRCLPPPSPLPSPLSP